MSADFPGQIELPGMPEPVTPPEPEKPEPMWVDCAIEVSLSVRIDVAGALFENLAAPTGFTSSDTDQPLDFEALTVEWLHANGYAEWERGRVFIYNQVSESLNVDCWRPGIIEEQPFGSTTDIEFRWTRELEAELRRRVGQ